MAYQYPRLPGTRSAPSATSPATPCGTARGSAAPAHPPARKALHQTELFGEISRNVLSAVVIVMVDMFRQNHHTDEER
jgi:hypothetical protein